MKNNELLKSLGIIAVVAVVAWNVVIGASKIFSEEETAVDQDRLAQELAPVGQLNLAESVADAVVQTASADADGKTVYDATCNVCHGAGVAGAPKLGDAAIWKERLDQGMDTLVEHAIVGYQGKAGFMPPKGGNAGLSDEEVKAAVQYMVDNAGE